MTFLLTLQLAFLVAKIDPNSKIPETTAKNAASALAL
jgi:hypothetical protein